MNELDKNIRNLIKVRKAIKELENKEKELRSYFQQIMLANKINSLYGRNYYIDRKSIEKQIVDTDELKADGLYNEYSKTIYYDVYTGKKIKK